MNSNDETGELLGAEHVSIPAIHFRKFGTKETASVVGISAGKLQNWLTRGAIQLEGEQNPGRGQYRNYTAYEIARIALMKKLSECGVPLETSFKITSAMKGIWERVLGGHELYGGAEPSLQSWLVVALTRDWPQELKRSIVQCDAHTAVWIIDQIDKPDSDTGLGATLLTLGATPAIVVNMGAVLNRTIAELEGLSGARYDSRIAPLNRRIKIFIGRLGHVRSGESPAADYTVCASADSESEALGILDKVCRHDGGKYFVAISGIRPTKEELERISAEMEAVYQSQRKETGEILP